MEKLIEILGAIVTVAGQMSPYLLFGFIVAGFLYILVPATWVQKHLGGHGFLPVVKSVLLGVPLPLCSCGVIAVTASIRKQGAGKAAATGFLIATPQTGVDSILATWGMLGPVLGLIRPLLALVTGMAGGGLVALLDREESIPAGKSNGGASCSMSEATPAKRSIAEALHYGLVTLPADIAKPLVVGIVLAGMMGALLPAGLLNPYIGGGIVAILVMTVVGIPLYVCATASIPLAVGFIHLGASPGAALAFLIAGPATNAATVATLWKVMGKKTTFIYLITVAMGAILSGLFYDMLIGQSWMANIFDLHQHEHGAGEGGWFNVAAALVLFVVVLNSLYGERIRFRLSHWTKRHETGEDGQEMHELSISGMTCGHCAGTVAQKLKMVEGVKEVTIDLPTGRARIGGTVRQPESLLRAVEEAGYHALIVK